MPQKQGEGTKYTHARTHRHKHTQSSLALPLRALRRSRAAVCYFLCVSTLPWKQLLSQVSQSLYEPLYTYLPLLVLSALCNPRSPADDVGLNCRCRLVSGCRTLVSTGTSQSTGDTWSLQVAE